MLKMLVKLASHTQAVTTENVTQASECSPALCLTITLVYSANHCHSKVITLAGGGGVLGGVLYESYHNHR